MKVADREDAEALGTVTVASPQGSAQSGTVQGPIPRERLFERLDAAVEAAAATVVVAPAGAGKTVLVRSWLDQLRPRRDVAWVSVRRDEHRAQRLWMDVVAEIARSVAGAVGLEPVPRLQFDGEAVVERLLDQLSALQRPLVLVIDDVHELASQEALSQLGLLIGESPPMMHVILLTRRDLRLGLHRLRVAGELAELRHEDLRFTPAEAGSLMLAAGVSLSEDDLSRLHSRTEGWGAGLRLAAMLLDGHPEPTRAIADFSGNERTVADYLIAEVLDLQPEDVQDFLMRTSILEEVTVPLATALTGNVAAERILRDLEDGGAFVVTVDHERPAFRYHQLFAEMLRLELRRRRPREVAGLHLVAAKWLAHEGSIVDAVRHAQLARDWGFASALLVENMYGLWLAGEEEATHLLVDAFPPEEVDARAELALVVAGDQLARGSLDDAAAHIALAERRADCVADDRRRQFDVGLAVLRLSLARRRADFTAALEQVAPLLTPVEARTHGEVALNEDLRAVALMNLGTAEAWSPAFEEGLVHLREGADLAQRIDRPFLEVACRSQAALAIGRSSFSQAERAAREVIAAAASHGWEDAPVAAAAHAALGAALMHGGRLAEAEASLERARRALRSEAEPALALLVFAAKGAVAQARGRHEEALAEYETVERMQDLLTTRHPLVLQVLSARLQIWILRGELGAAREELGGLSEADLRWHTPREAMAALALADGAPEEAIAVLEPVLDGNVGKQQRGVVVRALLLQAQARTEIGDASGVAADVEHALQLAARDGLIFSFLWQPFVPSLLKEHRGERTSHGPFIAQILDVIAGSEPHRSADRAAVDDRFSDAELRVLRYLPSTLTANEIAAELYLSVHTVKTHMRRIYAKLEAHTRSEAVDRARRAGLLGSSTYRL